MIHVTHVTSLISRSGIGVSTVVWALARHELKYQVQTTVAGIRDQYTDLDTQEFGDLQFFAGKSVGPAAWNHSPALRRFVRDLPSVDILHSHGLWMYPNRLARVMSERKRIPLIISLHGMLNRWAQGRSAWKKRIVAFLSENRNLHRAACFHALCEAEYRNIREYGLKTPVAVIPNGVNLAQFDISADESTLFDRFPLLRGKRRAIFLSRIHRTKGLPNLLIAWKSVFEQQRDWVLLAAGPEQLGHQKELRQLTHELGIENQVVFSGPLFGEMKHAALAGSDFFVLPSFSEGFTMSILEAAACRLPVLLTPACNFPELPECGGGLVFDPCAAALENGLRQLTGFSDTRRHEMGCAARTLIENHYTWTTLAKKMTDVYRWLAGKDEAPDCIRHD